MAMFSSLLESLKVRLNEWLFQVKKKTEFERQIADIDSEMKRLDAVMETQSNALVEKQGRLDTLKKEHAAGSGEREELYGDKNPDDEESRLNKAGCWCRGSRKGGQNPAHCVATEIDHCQGSCRIPEKSVSTWEFWN